jgi:hypothetical protein
MMSDIELETSRLVFEIEKEIMLSQLREMLEKTMKIENALRKSINESQDQTDYYRPCGDIAYPAKNKVRFQ